MLPGLFVLVWQSLSLRTVKQCISKSTISGLVIENVCYNFEEENRTDIISNDTTVCRLPEYSLALAELMVASNQT